MEQIIHTLSALERNKTNDWRYWSADGGNDRKGYSC